MGEGGDESHVRLPSIRSPNPVPSVKQSPVTGPFGACERKRWQGSWTAPRESHGVTLLAEFDAESRPLARGVTSQPSGSATRCSCDGPTLEAHGRHTVVGWPPHLVDAAAAHTEAASRGAVEAVTGLVGPPNQFR